MSNLLRIEQALATTDAATFQRVCDTLLHARGYERLTPVGAVLGASKVAKGTPDTRIALPNGKFVFAEYTTQQSGTCDKLLRDLEKCFNEAKTGIPVGRIQEITLCFTEKLDNAEEAQLFDECKKHGVDCLMLGLGAIALDLYRKYPTIAHDFLGIKVDTLQILRPADFVHQYGRNHLTPPVNTAFHFRTAEIEQALNALQGSSLLIIAGSAGVGKTRFALECADRFAVKNREFTVHCIHNRGLSLYEDVRAYFGPPGKYLIVVDDANRTTGLQYVLDVLNDKNDGRETKIICTVRDYALEKVVLAVRPYGTPQCIKLEPFSKDEIRDLVREECNVQNRIYLDRIVDIANGNPRLALMAAKTAKDKGTLESIKDVSSLYDTYFDSIRNDIDALDNSNVLAAAGLLAFLRVVDRTNSELMAVIERGFHVTSDAFWDGAMQLHHLELVDVYESDVVKLNDQVLATYLFYLAFFKKRLLPLDVLLSELFPRFRNRLVDALNPVTNTFQSSALVEEVQKHVVCAWDAFAEREDRTAFGEFIATFAPARPTEALLFVKQQLDALAITSGDDSLPGLQDPQSPTIKPESLLAILHSFRNADAENLSMAMELICNYVEKMPTHYERVVQLLSDDFGIDISSFRRGCYRQIAVIEILANRAQDGTNALFTNLFLKVAESYLQVEFHKTTAERSRTVTFTRFAAVWTSELELLRRRIWETLFRLVVHTEYQPEVLRLLVECGRRLHWLGRNDGTAAEALTVLALIANHLNPSSVAHCAAVQNYLDVLDKQDVRYDSNLRARFQCEALSIIETLTGASLDHTELPWREIDTKWRAGIRAMVANYDANAHGRLLQLCDEVRVVKISTSGRLSIEAGAEEALLVAATDTPNVFVEVMRAYLDAGNFLHWSPSSFVYHLSRICGPDVTFDLLMCPEYDRNRQWLFALLQSLAQGDVRREHLEILFSLYTEATVDALPVQWDYLNRFASIEPNVVYLIARVLAARVNTEPMIARALSPLFRLKDKAAAGSLFNEFLQNDPVFLRQSYFAFIANDPAADHDEAVFNEFLNRDAEFIDAYVAWLFARDEHRRVTHHERNYDAVWNRDDYSVIARRMIELMYTEVRKRNSAWHPYPGRLFWVDVWDENPDPLVQTRQDEVLTQMLRERQADSEFVVVTFWIVSRFSNKRRLGYVKILAEIKYRFERFCGLELQPSSWGWEGSQVPVLEERAAFWQEAREIFSGIDLLQHRKFIEERLEHARQHVADAKREEFMED